jgi:predicted amidohydrolase
VSVLCCPEALIGGLADNAADPFRYAVTTAQLESLLQPLSSETVTTIVGFTEQSDGRLYNSAAIFHRGSVTGVYRKVHPAINRSVYHAGTEVPVFRVGVLTFGIVICNDSNFRELGRAMAAQGASVLFIPSNNGMPSKHGGAELIQQARTVDVATATGCRLWVIRADTAGHTGTLISHGSSAIIDPHGRVVCVAGEMREDFLIADVDTVRIESEISEARAHFRASRIPSRSSRRRISPHP